jgi:hypothetical protein
VEEDEGGPLDSLVKEANRLGATCYGTTSNVGAEPQGAKRQRGEAPRTSESSLMKGGATECRGRLR